MRKPLIALTLTSLLAAGSANAALFDRGNGLVYDSTLNVTWLQNANLAATQTFGVTGIAASGAMELPTAQLWVTAMNAANYKGYSDWRLPVNTPVNGSAYQLYDAGDFWTGARDVSYNITSTASPLAHLFYASLGNAGLRTTTGATRSGSAGTDYGLVNAGPFQNLVYTSTYWTGSSNFSPLGVDQAWVFSERTGYQFQVFADSELLAWALRPGDVAAVPEPAAAWLMLGGIAALWARRR